MKKQTFLTLSLVALLALPVTEAISQTTNDECAAVLQSAQTGREAATARIAQAEALVKERLSAARQCIEQFGDVVARTTVSIGGVDLAPLRDRLFNSTCNVIQSQLTKAQADLQREIAASQSQIQAQLGANGSRALSSANAGFPLNTGTNTGVTSTATNDQGLFSTVACRLFGKC